MNISNYSLFDINTFKRFVLKPVESASTDEDLQLRLVRMFVNKSLYSIQDGILKTPVEGDIGTVLGQLLLNKSGDKQFGK